uniref:Ribosomal protein S8 n=1 Tax=Undaria pinnatifida TaxID=74381 RepID=V9PB06_UNDPI|nr:ribosomal protein S8 [Undaria pinnatifida]YP_011008422.1 ribosomal protein S8 [Undaria peterseniana]AGW46819.1 ribosomal protein S8 [Undaria pinnatifida]WBP70393.1 ribosomal protein S8 [Undaria peterseniana]
MLSKIINRLRNGYMVYHFGVSFKEVRFSTKVLDILWKENLIKGYVKTNDGIITVFLRYHDGFPICTRLVVISRPRDRIYLSLLDLARLSNDFGILILSTTKGIMTNEQCVRKGEGGEVLAYAS